MFVRFKYFDYIKNNENKLYKDSFQINIGNLLPNQFEKEFGKQTIFLYDLYYEEELLKNYREAEKIVIYVTPYIFHCNTQIIWYEYEKDFINCKDFVSDTQFEFSINFLYRGTHYDIIYDELFFLENENVLNYFKLSNERRLSDTLLDNAKLAYPTVSYNSINELINKPKEESILTKLAQINGNKEDFAQTDLLAKSEDLLEFGRKLICYACRRNISEQILNVSVCYSCFSNIYFINLKAKYNEFLGKAKDLFDRGQFDRIRECRKEGLIVKSV